MYKKKHASDEPDTKKNKFNAKVVDSVVLYPYGDTEEFDETYNKSRRTPYEFNKDLIHKSKCKYVQPTPYVSRDEYLQKCNQTARMGKRNPLIFFLLHTEVIYRHKHLRGMGGNNNYSNNYATNTENNVFNKYGKVGNGNTQAKDMILVRGRTLVGGQPVFGLVEYDHNEYSPKMYIESRDGFGEENYSYKENKFVVDYVSPHHRAIDQMKDTTDFGNDRPRGVDKFMRWLINYLSYTATVENGRKWDCNPDPSAIVSYSYYYNATGLKTLYGYVPEPENGGPNRYIIEINLTSKTKAVAFLKFFESDEYLNFTSTFPKPVVPAVRSFETLPTFDSTWRFQHGLSFSKCCYTSNYEYLTPNEITESFFDINPMDNRTKCHFVRFKYNAITPYVDHLPGQPKTIGDCIGEEWIGCKPKYVSFDIEVNVPIDKLNGKPAFGTATWTPKNYAKRYKYILSTESQNRISACSTPQAGRNKVLEELTTEETYIKYCASRYPKELNENLPKYERRKFLDENIVPKFDETDEITTICCVIRQGATHDSMKSPLGCYLFTWKPKNTKLSSNNNTTGNTNKLSGDQPHNLIKRIEMEVNEKQHFSSTSSSSSSSSSTSTTSVGDRLKLVDVFYNTNVNGKNIKLTSKYFTNAKIVVLNSEYEVITEFIKVCRQSMCDIYMGHNILSYDMPYIIDRVEELSKKDSILRNQLIKLPFTLGYIKYNKSRYYSVSFMRNQSLKTSWSVETPGFDTIDIYRSFINESYGKKNESYKLSRLMPTYLKYPGSTEKMRKLEIDILHTREFWAGGGDGLSYFLAYCLFDALGAALLCEKMNFMGISYVVSEKSGATPQSIYLKGAQNIVLTMVYKKIWDEGKKFIMPDYGVRELHFPDLWYAHLGTGGKLLDVRELYETVPALKRKWMMGGIRLIPDKRGTFKNKKTQQQQQQQYQQQQHQHPILRFENTLFNNENPYFPASGTKEDAVYVYDVAEYKKKKKEGLIPKTKAYMGANVPEVIRFYTIGIIMATLDYESMYPTIACDLCLCFINMVTEFTRTVFKIPRMTLSRIILGPSNLIQMGDVMISPLIARRNDFVDTDEVVYTYFYQRHDNILSSIIKDLLFTRRNVKKEMGLWKNEKQRLGLILELLKIAKKKGEKDKEFHPISEAINFLKSTNLVFVNNAHMESVIERGNKILEDWDGLDNDRTMNELLTWLIFEQLNDKQKSQFFFEKEAYSSNNQSMIIENDTLMNDIKIKHIYAEMKEANLDTQQLGLKLNMNSIYGVVSTTTGTLPMIQLGSSITAFGRCMSKMVENVANNVDCITMCHQEKICEKVMEINGGRHPDSFRIPGKKMCSTTSGGDTDSIFVLFRNELFPSPLGEDLVYKHVGKYYTSKINSFLPRKITVKTNDNGVPSFEFSRGIMNIQFENAKYSLLELKKKMAASAIFRSDDPFAYKGLDLKKSNRLDFNANLEKEVLTKILLRKNFPGESIVDRVVEAIKFVRKRILDLLKGDYNPADFIVKVRLNKEIAYFQSTGNALPAHVKVAMLNISRGQEVNVGDYIPTVYISPLASIDYTNTKIEEGLRTGKDKTFFGKTMLKKAISTTNSPTTMGSKKSSSSRGILSFFSPITTQQRSNANIKGGTKTKKDSEDNSEIMKLLKAHHSKETHYNRSNILEDANFVLKNNIPLDILYYLETVIFKKLGILLSPIIFSFEDYPSIPYGLSSVEKKIIKGQQNSIEEYQKDVMIEILKMGEINDIILSMKKATLERESIATSRKNSKIEYLPQNPTRKCLECSKYFTHYNASEGLYDDINLTENYVKGTLDKHGFYTVCEECKSTSRREQLVMIHKREKEKAEEQMAKCNETCWKCIDNTRVSVRDSMVSTLMEKHGNDIFEGNNLLKEYTTEKERESIYFTKPDLCTLSDCQIYKEKQLLLYNIHSNKSKICILNDMPSW